MPLAMQRSQSLDPFCSYLFHGGMEDTKAAAARPRHAAGKGVSTSYHPDGVSPAAARHQALNWHAFDGGMLGKVASAQVVRARDNSGSEWACKLIFEPDARDRERIGLAAPDDPDRPSARERAQTEAQIAVALSDQAWAVPVHNVFMAHVRHGDGRIAPMTVLQMPIMAGGDLRTHILKEGPRRPLPLDEAKCILLQAVNAVRQCHACGVLHRDIKADNFLLGGDGQLHLTDYGMSGFISPADRPGAGASGRDVRTLASAARQPPGGSLELLSPARLAGGDDGTAGDWWALGGLALELLSGPAADDCFWPFRAPGSSASDDDDDGGGGGGDDGPSSVWLRAVQARDIAFSPAVGGAGRELISGLLHPTPYERWGMEEVVGCDFFPDSCFQDVARRYPCLAADMQELQEIRATVRLQTLSKQQELRQ